MMDSNNNRSFQNGVDVVWKVGIVGSSGPGREASMHQVSK
jgi:hypothetical protein